MADDLFVLREDIFDPATTLDDIDVSEAEAKYAALFAEVIWDGVITPEKRRRLNTATQTFGLGPVRAKQIESALSAAHVARHRITVVEQRPPPEPDPEATATKADTAAETSEAPADTLAPMAQADDLAIRALQRRIALLEAQNDALRGQSDDLDERNEQLENLVDQLQQALESTLDELAELRQQHEQLEQSAPLDASEPAPVTEREPAPPTKPQSSPPSAPSPPVRPKASGPASAPPTPTLLSSGSEPPGPSDQAPATTRSARPPASRVRDTLDDMAMAMATVEMADADPPGDVELTVPGTARWDSARIQSALERAPKRADDDLWGSLATPTRRGDPDQMHRLLRQQPRDADLLHALFRSLQRSEDYDRRWCIAQALDYLGEADEAEAELYARHATTDLVRPRRAVNEDEWHELLYHADEDPLTGQILAAIAPAVLLGHMPAIRASITTEHLESNQRVDPATTTLQAARCFIWAAAVLGLHCPPLYLAPDLPGTAEVVLDPDPKTRLSQHLLAGRTTAELAFVAGYHLTWYRREHLLGRPTRSLRRAEDMFLAALLIGNPGLPMTPEVKHRVEPIAETIRPLLGPADHERLRHCFTLFIEQGGRTKLKQWLDAVESTASCAGLILANDLRAADAMLRLENDTARTNRHIDELITYATGSRYSRLRKRIGIAVGRRVDAHPESSPP